ncbi:TonB-dependent receptor plug domain-containing protein [Aliikangiella coralliicola]|uniref:TonB-dependent receptor n=1 Tax=Aliikangiella coralliicola TaxID=2592383 RepID=A0A545UH03_9GAMM|nr:TonB-dependent receptor [Aliikangiella coralliicola]TQV88740.1 TonB-dependent receptor [Aliikangiella coralliicola]
MKNKLFIFLRVSVMCLCFINAEFAYGFSDNTQENVITITGTRTARAFIESPVSSAQISAEDIQQSAADNIADALRDVPGIQVDDAATPGMKRITLRGESSLRVAILIDGQEITDHSTYGAPLLLDTSMVERIEVIRGTSSVLYGGKALGGVINVITKKGGGKPIQFSATSSYHSATNGQQLAASVYGEVAGFDYRVSFSDTDHEDRETPDETINNSSFANDGFMIYLARQVGEHLIGLTYDEFNLSSEIATSIPNFLLDMPQRDRTKFSIFYQLEDIGETFKKIHLDAYDQTIDRTFLQHFEMNTPLQPPMSMNMIVDTEIKEKLDTQGINSQVDFSLNERHYIIMGLQNTRDKVDKNTVNVTQSTMLIGGIAGTPQIRESSSLESAELETNAIYLQDEWRISNQWIITIGARHYSVDASLIRSSRTGLNPSDNKDSELIGSFAVNYAVNSKNNLRAVFSQGYHYPTLLQIATGATAAGTYRNPNPDLSPETSDNFEFGYRLRNGDWLVDSVFFYTEAENYITTRSCSELPLTCLTPEDDIYINADAAKTKGIELNLVQGVSQDVSSYLSLTWLSREETFGSFTTKDTGSPSLFGRLGLKVKGASEWFNNYYVDTYIRAASGAKVSDANGERETFAGWGTLNLALGSYLGAEENYQLNLDFSNLLDKKYSPAKETLIAPGRSLMIRLSADF